MSASTQQSQPRAIRPSTVLQTVVGNSTQPLQVLQANMNLVHQLPSLAIKPEVRKTVLQVTATTHKVSQKHHGSGPSVARRNARERNRVKQVNQGFAHLRAHLPQPGKGKRLSKVETLRTAVRYIRNLQLMLDNQPIPDDASNNGENVSPGSLEQSCSPASVLSDGTYGMQPESPPPSPDSPSPPPSPQPESVVTLDPTVTLPKEEDALLEVFAWWQHGQTDFQRFPIT